jgi:mannose-6-phosphate isomerase-like protein (cupin superfamily)
VHTVADAPEPRPPYEFAPLSEIAPTPYDGSSGFEIPGEWRQIRHHFAMREFSANAFLATEAGQQIVHEHAERANDDASKPGGEELYYIAAGRAKVRLDGEVAELEAGTLVFVGEPTVIRSFTALEPGTTVLAFGTNPGVEFVVSRFELAVSPEVRWR